MTVNRGGNLNEAYFISYLKLIMASRQCDAACAENVAFESFFNGDPEKYGPATFERFKRAAASLK
ncbi:MAG TPA: hypothetical protein VLQ20_08600 [Planococcus sp. (in: firmicutes)]|nr:hypothetical protein [Planococcus sp. (in: firmicutes)]